MNASGLCVNILDLDKIRQNIFCRSNAGNMNFIVHIKLAFYNIRMCHFCEFLS